eukprot:12929357-Prorocentrum_lima.AAC.1
MRRGSRNPGRPLVVGIGLSHPLFDVGVGILVASALVSGRYLVTQAAEAFPEEFWANGVRNLPGSRCAVT